MRENKGINIYRGRQLGKLSKKKKQDMPKYFKKIDYKSSAIIIN